MPKQASTGSREKPSGEASTPQEEHLVRHRFGKGRAMGPLPPCPSTVRGLVPADLVYPPFRTSSVTVPHAVRELLRKSHEESSGACYLLKLEP